MRNIKILFIVCAVLECWQCEASASGAVIRASFDRAFNNKLTSKMKKLEKIRKNQEIMNQKFLDSLFDDMPALEGVKKKKEENASIKAIKEFFTEDVAEFFKEDVLGFFKSLPIIRGLVKMNNANNAIEDYEKTGFSFGVGAEKLKDNKDKAKEELVNDVIEYGPKIILKGIVLGAGAYNASM